MNYFLLQHLKYETFERKATSTLNKPEIISIYRMKSEMQRCQEVFQFK